LQHSTKRETGKRAPKRAAAKHTNFRLTEEDKALLATLATQLGINRVAVMRLALRTLAKKKLANG
jgi:hypothetical protein